MYTCFIFYLKTFGTLLLVGWIFLCKKGETWRVYIMKITILTFNLTDIFNFKFSVRINVLSFTLILLHLASGSLKSMAPLLCVACLHACITNTCKFLLLLFLQHRIAYKLRKVNVFNSGYAKSTEPLIL